MKIIYLVEEGIDYEGSSIVKAFDNRKSAINYIEENYPLAIDEDKDGYYRNDKANNFTDYINIIEIELEKGLKNE